MNSSSVTPRIIARLMHCLAVGSPRLSTLPSPSLRHIAVLGLVVLGAFINATWNLLSKRAASARLGFIAAYTAIACISYFTWVAWLLVQGRTEWTRSVTVCLIVSGVLHLGPGVIKLLTVVFGIVLILTRGDL
jgi:hypothetical protein